MTDRRDTVVQCLRCGHVATLDRATDALPLVRLTRRLVCSRCGARALKAERVAPERPEARTRRH